MEIIMRDNFNVDNFKVKEFINIQEVIIIQETTKKERKMVMEK